MNSGRKKAIIPIVPLPAQVTTQALYKNTEKIYPRTINGYFKTWRWVMIWLTQLFFYGMPWLNYGERQALLFDISAHRFYIFGLVIYPQDLYYLAIILIVCALALFLFTTVAGRLWCGFSCPQSVYTEIFLWMERKIEDDHLARQKLDRQGFGLEKISKKGGKHLAWLAFSLITGFTFLGYFTPIRGLLENTIQSQLSAWETFWMLFYGFATYGNAGFMREQVCKHMCPYARFQSAMFDAKTLIVAYDAARGEPRGGRSKDVDYQSNGLGACVDCNICVQVCPVGIDIRNGLQYECISCGLCIDACDQVMDRMGYARGLIRFSTADQKSSHSILNTIIRPRVMVYTILLGVILTLFAVALYYKPGFKVDVIRDRGVMYRQLDDTHYQNMYQFHISNATEKNTHFSVYLEDAPLLEVQSGLISIEAAGEKLVPITVGNVNDRIASGMRKIVFVVKDAESGESVKVDSTFYVPQI